MDEWTCRHCGEPIGAYEPAVVVDETGPHRTSKLREPEDPEGAIYHSECWEAASDET